MDQLKKGQARAEETARHQAAVRNYYESGDESFLTPLFVDLSRILPRFLISKNYRMDRETVQEATQNSLIEILLSFRKRVFEEDRIHSVASWAMSVCWNCCLSVQYGKKNPGRPGPVEYDFRSLNTAAEESPKEFFSTPEEKAKATELIKDVTAAVLRLDTNVKNAMLMHFYHGLSHQEGADKLGIPIRKFTWRTIRGLSALKSWAVRQDIPPQEVYAALAWVDTGGLFRNPENSHNEAA